MNLNLLIFIIVLYIIGSTLFRKLTFYLLDILYRVLIIFATYWFIKPQVNISENQWFILAALFIFGFIFTLINSPLKSPHYHLVGVVLAPLAEEFMFRGGLLHVVPGSMLTRVVITSIIFGLYHFKNIQFLTFFSTMYQILYATIIGVPLAFLALSTHSLFLPIVLHTVNNILAGTLTMRFAPNVIKMKKK